MPALARICSLHRGSGWPVLLALVFVAAQLALTIHVSADLLQDHSCPVCQVAQLPSSTSHSQPDVRTSFLNIKLAAGTSVPAVINTPFQASQRAPPASLIF